MTGQLSMFKPDSVDSNVAKNEMRVVTWNIANPSLDRAKKQFEWLANTKANVLVLTEAKSSEGCKYLSNSLQDIGFNVFFPQSSQNGYSVLVAEKGFQGEEHCLGIEFLPERIQAINLSTFMGKILLVGIYVPSRGPQERRNVDKRLFQDQLIRFFSSLNYSELKYNLLVGGDLNVIPLDHEPKYSIFGDWEYQFYNSFLDLGMVDVYKYVNPDGQEHSWLGRSGDGYRFDHFIISTRFSQYITSCHFIHEVRKFRLSDHSALYLTLSHSR